MKRLSQDTVIAIFLLLASGGLMIASFDIREPDYGQLSPAAWPRAVVAALGVLSFLYLLQSLRAGAGTPAGAGLPERTGEDGVSEKGASSAGGFFYHWRNVIWCFLLFFLYLLTMPWLGMLIGGTAFAFLLMTALGGHAPRQLALHAAVSIICIGGMWALFTFELRVPLPPGQILPRF
ncbi:MAG: tripartite tricarboxylate transporter TctB family protein [Alphaproteobacteria bacterium]